MVCSPEIRGAIATVLNLPDQPSPSATWIDRLYTCSYELPDGRFVISVKELSDAGAARAYVDALRARLGPAAPILGLANLGLPAYETSTGTVIFLKGATALEVDASALPAEIGPASIPREEFSYKIASDIIGCWKGD